MEHINTVLLAVGDYRTLVEQLQAATEEAKELKKKNQRLVEVSKNLKKQLIQAGKELSCLASEVEAKDATSMYWYRECQKVKGELESLKSSAPDVPKDQEEHHD